MFVCLSLVLLLFPIPQEGEYAISLRWISDIEDLLQTNPHNVGGERRSFHTGEIFGYIDLLTGKGYAFQENTVVGISDDLYVRREMSEGIPLLFSSSSEFIQAIPVRGQVFVHDDEVFVLEENQQELFRIRQGTIDQFDVSDSVILRLFPATEEVLISLLAFGLADLNTKEVFFEHTSPIVDYKEEGSLIAMLSVDEKNFLNTVLEIYDTDTQNTPVLLISEQLGQGPAYIEMNSTYTLLAYDGFLKFYALGRMEREVDIQGEVQRVFATDMFFGVVARDVNASKRLMLYDKRANYIGTILLSEDARVLSVADGMVLFGTQESIFLLSL